MELVNQQEPLRKSTVKRVIEKTFNVVRLHLSHIETYGVFGEALFGKTFLEEIREVDGSMKRVADYFVDGGDASRMPMEKLRATREMIHRLIKMVGNMDAAYTAALFRIRRNIDMALKCAALTAEKAKREQAAQQKKKKSRL